MDRRELLSKLNGALEELDEVAAGEEFAELAAELEDAIFLLECAEDDEEASGALEEIAGLAWQLQGLSGRDAALRAIAGELLRLAT